MGRQRGALKAFKDERVARPNLYFSKSSVVAEGMLEKDRERAGRPVRSHYRAHARLFKSFIKRALC